MRYGRGSQQYLEALLALAREYFKQKEYLNAETQYLQACKVAQATIKGDPLAIAKIKLELADFYWEIGEKNKAVYIYTNQVDMSLHDEMRRFLEKHDFDNALKLGFLSMRGRARYAPEHKAQVYHMEIWIGVVSLAAKKYEQAEKYLTAGVRSFESIDQGRTGIVATAYRHLGDLYSATNQSGRSEEMYKKVASIGESGAKIADTELLLAWFQLGHAAVRRHQLKRAEKFWLKIENFERNRSKHSPADKMILTGVVSQHASALRANHRDAEAAALESEFKPVFEGK